MPKPQTFTEYPDNLKALTPFGQPTRAVIDHWHDGDTCWVMLDAQWGEYPFRKIRARGIDTPELSTMEGKAAFVFAVQLAPPDTHIAITDSVKVPASGVMDQSEDRYVARLTLPDGRDFGQAMIEAGHAVVMER